MLTPRQHYTYVAACVLMVIATLAFGLVAFPAVLDYAIGGRS